MVKVEREMSSGHESTVAANQAFSHPCWIRLVVGTGRPTFQVFISKFVSQNKNDDLKRNAYDVQYVKTAAIVVDPNTEGACAPISS